MEQLKADLATLLKGKGREAESILKRLDNITREEKTRRDDLEYMAHELQMKVISLQQEMDTPTPKASPQKESSKPSKAEKSVADALAKEKQENLELKAQLSKNLPSEKQMLANDRKLQAELEEWKSQCHHLRYEVERLSNTNHSKKEDKNLQQQQQQQEDVIVMRKAPMQTSSINLSPAKTPSPPLPELTRKNSKDRKSRPRSGDDPTATKRRRSSHDCREDGLPPPGAKLKSAKSVGDLKSGPSVSDNHHKSGIGSLERRAEAEADQDYDQHTLVERINRLDAEVNFLRIENDALTKRLYQTRGNEDSASENGSTASLSSLGRVAEVEECVESLREQIEAKEYAEKLLRERLRFVEASAEESESAELLAREQYETLLARETENSRQVRQLQQTCRELRDCLVDKDIMEQGLTDKVDFLQKAEAASVHRIEELEGELKEMDAQLQEAVRLADDFSGSESSNQRELNKIQELKHQMTFLETDNKALQGRVNELEENEETLRENWRRVAEEDFSRIQGLEEKVKNLEVINKQLRADMAEAQEYFVISTIPETSLAAELADSQNASAPGTGSAEIGNVSGHHGDGEHAETCGMVRKDSEKRTLRDRLKTLEKQLSDVSEKKNSTIENLQETIVGLKENEIKLSETISEMEMTEREIRAKLALYESSEVTVEKMLKYQSKIEELRTSQESLLDQLETMENQEMTLTEKMQEMERTLRGKIVTLEVEIKGYKTRELKDAARIRELEKQEKELTEKTGQQAEKENNLYVKISSLMDEAKTAKAQVETLREQLADKEDKVRKAKLLEVKFLEIEMEFSKKMSDLSSKLRHKEEELRQKEAAQEEQIGALKEEMTMKDSEHNNHVKELEGSISAKETEMNRVVEDLKKQLNDVSSERNSFETQVSDLTSENRRLSGIQGDLDKEVSDLKEELAGLQSFESESQRMVAELQESLELEKGFTEEAENKVKSLLEEIQCGKEKIISLENNVASLEADLVEKTANVEKSVEKESALEKEKKTLSDELKIKTEQINDMEKDLDEEKKHVAQLEMDKERLEGEIKALSDGQSENKDTIAKLHASIAAANKEHAEKVASLEEEQKVLENELKNKVMFLNTQLTKEVESRENEASALEKARQKEQNLSKEIAELQKETESLKKELVDNLSELEAKNKENCELSLQLSNIKHSNETLKHEFDTFKENAAKTQRKLESQSSENSIQLRKLNDDLSKAVNEIQDLHVELRQKESVANEAHLHREKVMKEKQEEIAKLQEEQIVKEQMVQEHMQKSESAVVQSKQDHHSEMGRLKQQLAELEESNNQLKTDKQAFDSCKEDLQSQIQTLELYLSEVNFKLDSKSSQCRKREDELANAIADHEKSVREMKKLNEELHDLKRQMEAKDIEFNEKLSENSDSLSLVSAKEQELEHAQEELKKCLKEIEHFKSQVQSKEEAAKEKDQEHQVLRINCENLSKQYQQRDADFKEIETKVTGYEFKLQEAENRYRELEAKCASLEMQLEERFALAHEGEKILKAKEEECSQLASKLIDVEREFELVTQVVDKSEQILVEKKKECNSMQSKLTEAQKEKDEMESNLSDKNKECEELKSRLEEINQTNDSLNQLKEKLINAEEQVSSDKQHISDLTEEVTRLKEALEEKEKCNKKNEQGKHALEQQHMETKVEVQKLQSKVNYFEDLSSHNQSLHDSSKERLKELESALDQSRDEALKVQNMLLEKDNFLKEMADANSTSQNKVENLSQKISELEDQIEILEKEKVENREVQSNLKTQLSEKEVELYTLQAEAESLKEAIKQGEEDAENAKREVDSLHEKLRISEKLVEDKVKEISIQSDKKDAELVKLQGTLNEIKKERNELLSLCDELKGKDKDNKAVQVEKESLELRLKDAEQQNSHLTSQLNDFKEQFDISDERLASLQDQLKEAQNENQKLSSSIHQAKSANDKKEVQIKVLDEKIQMFQIEDNKNEMKLKQLDEELKSIKLREHTLSHRVDELEGKEKELLEQIADIETTVIVPLETENQELKDEVAIVKQERDEALAAAVDKAEEDQDSRQTTESLCKSLEDALEKRDEMEKKVEILMNDISKLEEERDGLNKKIADLHASGEDVSEKCELLEIELERLKDLERQSSVVEEAETSLMDRVLDLEEREAQLVSELQDFKDRDVQSCGCQTDRDETATATEMTEKVGYLEQKIEVLKDAESRYMDTIVGLEEANSRLQAQLEQSENVTPSSKEHEHIMPVNETLSASKTFTTYANIKLDNLSQQNSEAATNESTTQGALSPSEIDIDEHLITSDTQNQKLLQALEESEKKNKDLEMRLELLQDSESRLMERLLETEELSEKQKSGAESGPESNGSADSATEENLQHKIDTLVEENEFLAGSIENYKQLYKEEREKTNALNDRVLEDSSVFHELEETRSELESVHCQMLDLQTECEDRLKERDSIETELRSLLEQSRQRQADLDHQVLELQNAVQESEQVTGELREREANTQNNVSNLEQNLQVLQNREADLLDHIRNLEVKVEYLQHNENELNNQVLDLQQNLHDQQLKEHHLQEQINCVQGEKDDLEQKVQSGQVRQQSLESQVHDLEQEAQYLRSHLEEAMSDSGVSGEGNKNRLDSFESDGRGVRSPPPIIEEEFVNHTAASANLSQPSGTKSPPYIVSKPTQQSARKVNPSPTPSTASSTHSRHSHAQSPPPVAPPRPRGRRSRPSSIDSISQEELIFLVEELQFKEAALKRRVRDLEAITDVDLPQRVDELERENDDLKSVIAELQEQTSSSSLQKPLEEAVEGTYVSLKNSSLFYTEGDSNNNSSISNNRSTNHQEAVAMLDKPGDILQQRIKELEHLDMINKNQLSELERDREVLHEIARKDKTTIHDLNVRIRELQLSERSLKEQVSSLEVSESSLFSRCEDLDATRSRLEDRVHELEVHERRLRELVRRLKLDEEKWLGRSGGMETALGELSASESQLKRLLQDAELEKGGLAERTAYMEARVKELETVEASLSQKVKILQNSETSLQKKLSQTENSEAAAHSKAAELDVLNADLSQRLQAGLEERAMLAQHLQQLHGQVVELDRRLLASRDSELAHKQHVESLQKNESSLQKKVREFELREIDSQARVRELEQTQEIINDKMAALQRSENRLKYRVHELEGIGGQIPGELTPDQKQKVPQKLEDCQKRVVVLQNHVENLQLQLRENLKNSQPPLALKDGEETVSVPVLEYNQLRARSTLLEESNYQLQEVERVNEELNDTILKLKDGKGASGHEVEVEVLKRRLNSYKACLEKLKSSLSTGQATSLVDPEQDSGPDGETLPARHLGGLESERVLQSVRGLEGKKANGLCRSSNNGLMAQESNIFKSKSASNLSSAPLSLDLSFAEDSSASMEANQQWSSQQKPNQEETHWRAIEARRAGSAVTSPRGGVASHANTGPAPPLPTSGGASWRDGGELSAPEVEEVTVALNLQSESELSSHYTSQHTKTLDSAQNDTDSSLSPVPPPRKSRKSAWTTEDTARGKSSESNTHLHQTGDADNLNNSNNSNITKTGDAVITATTNQKQYFGNGQKNPLPQQLSSIDHVTLADQNSLLSNTPQTPLASFGGQESYYLPTQSKAASDDDDDGPPPPLPTSMPPGSESQGSEGSLAELVSPFQEGGSRKDSLDESTSGMSIRQRIAMIEKQLQSDQFEPQVDSAQYWKTQATESLKQVQLLEKDNKHMKDDINKLEKELEEKRRHIHTLEMWLSSLDDLLKNKNKQTDREMVEQLQLELTKLRSELKKSGYRPVGDSMDPAALRTELEHRDREIVSKRTELQALSQELQKCKDECRSVEGMRRTALDSLRYLEEEVIGLQNKEKQLDEAQKELKELNAKTEKIKEVYEENLLLREKVHEGELELRRLRGLCDDFNNLSARYEELETQKQQADARLQPLESQLDRLARKCQQKDALLLDLGDELRHHSARQSQALDELERMQRGMPLEEYNTEFPQMINGFPLQHQQRRPGPSRSSSMEELDSHFNPLSNPTARERRKKSTTQYSNRPRSADGILESRGSETKQQPRRHEAVSYQPQAREFRRAGSLQNKFRVIADYDPSMFSQSGRPGLELELLEGDVVTIIGPMDRAGYYEGEVNGRSGLVPANYLLPLHATKDQRSVLRAGSVGQQLHGDEGDEDHSPEQILDMFNQLLYETPGQASNLQQPQDHQQQLFNQRLGARVPDPPSNLYVQESEDEDGTFVLSWRPPKLDASGCNNGQQVLGYMVYVDNQEYEQVPSVSLCQVLLEGLSPHQSHTLAVEALCGNGQASSRAQLLFQGVVSGKHHVRGAGHGNNAEMMEETLQNTDLSSILDKVNYRKGQRRKVLALYDYNPHAMSPGDFPHLELDFQAGDILTVYGEPRPDGFIHGEADGRRGLVPAIFVEDVSESPRHSQRVPTGAGVGEMSV